MSNTPTRIITGEVRLSYCRLNQPYTSNQGGEPKYSATLLIPKTDIVTKQKIDAAIEAAMLEAVTKRWGGVRPPVLPSPLRDGDGVRQDGSPFGAECKGHWIITASAKLKPMVVVAADLNTNIPQSEIYSGMYAQVSLNFFGYAVAGKKGIGCGLNNVLKTRDGEVLGGGYTAADDFGGTAAGQNYSQPAAATTAYQNPAPYGGQQPPYGYAQPAHTGYQPAYRRPAQGYQQPAQGSSRYDPLTGESVPF